MSVSATQVKELRERTGAGMMECKKALEATDGDMQKAIEELRKSGRAKADKKASRIAAEGVVIVRLTEDGKRGVMLEINSETDFVARDTNFVAFANAVAATALAERIGDVDKLAKITLAGTQTTVDEARQNLIAKVGENITIRRVILTGDTAQSIGSYLHGNRIGVVVALDVDNAELAKDIAMHIAASKPLVVNPEEVPADIGKIKLGIS